jgi:HTH-type transcriptional regulator, competence development regulator
MMKLIVNEERFLAAIDRAGDHEVGVGLLAADPFMEPPEERVLLEAVRVEPTHLAFGKLIHLLRRKKAWTMDRLAEQARIDTEEVLQIESNVDYRPEQRTVYQLAQVLSVPPTALMQLSGNATPRAEVMREAVRFAANSEPIAKLSPEEASAVESFVSALSRLADNKAMIP